MIGKAELLAFLDKEGFAYECEHHDAVLNMAESAMLDLSLKGARCKNLLLQDKRGQHYLVTTASEKSLCLAGVARALDSKRLSLASADKLHELLGLRAGSLSPLALVNDVSRKVALVVDSELADEPVFLLHPLENTATIAISRADLDAFLVSVDHSPRWVPLEARVPS